MPILDGYEVASRIRSLNFFNSRDIPIYILELNSFSNDDKLNENINGYIKKPINYNFLFRVINNKMKF